MINLIIMLVSQAYPNILCLLVSSKVGFCHFDKRSED
jgi:hypothetical protein